MKCPSVFFRLRQKTADHGGQTGLGGFRAFAAERAIFKVFQQCRFLSTLSLGKAPAKVALIAYRFFNSGFQPAETVDNGFELVPVDPA